MHLLLLIPVCITPRFQTSLFVIPGMFNLAFCGENIPDKCSLLLNSCCVIIGFQVTEAVPTDVAAVVPVAAPASAPAAERVIMPELPGLAFLGLPPLPALTTTERDVGPGALPPIANVGPGAPVGAQGSAEAPNPDVNRPLTLNDDNTPNAFAPAYDEVGKTFQVRGQTLAPFCAHPAKLNSCSFLLD